MPIFEYKCKNCGNTFDELVKDCNQAVTCPKCGQTADRSYSGKVYSATGKSTGGCSGNCSNCSGCGK